VPGRVAAVTGRQLASQPGDLQRRGVDHFEVAAGEQARQARCQVTVDAAELLQASAGCRFEGPQGGVAEPSVMAEQDGLDHRATVEQPGIEGIEVGPPVVVLEVVWNPGVVAWRRFQRPGPSVGEKFVTRHVVALPDH
jgi:hypothetical protein